jgi:hypothetical protein
MKGSLAKAIRTIDALRAKKEALEGAPAKAEVVAEVPVVEAVAEATADVQAVTETIEAEVPAVAETEASAPLETPEA